MTYSTNETKLFFLHNWTDDNSFKTVHIAKHKGDTTFFSCEAGQNMKGCVRTNYDYSPIFNWICKGSQ